MDQNSNRDQDMPNRQSNMEQAEGSRGRSRSDAEGERNQASGDQSRENSGGITNRPLDREQSEQENLPERGQSREER